MKDLRSLLQHYLNAFWYHDRTLVDTTAPSSFVGNHLGFNIQIFTLRRLYIKVIGSLNALDHVICT